VSESKFISLQTLYDDPKRWLSVPHERHESLGKLMELTFPGFGGKLKDAKIHCLECEGEKPFLVIIRDTWKEALCTGFVGDKSSVELFSTAEIKKE